MSLRTKIVWYVVTLSLVAIVGSWLTPGLDWCKAGPASDRSTYLGFTCDAWVQSASQLFGGLATVIAVVWTIDHGRQKDNEASRTRLAAIAHELRSAQSGILDARDFFESEVFRCKTSKGQQAPHLPYSLLRRIELRIYAATCANVAHLTEESAGLVIEAVAAVDAWNTGAVALIEMCEEDKGDRDRIRLFMNSQEFAETASSLCYVACKAIDKELGTSISKPPHPLPDRRLEEAKPVEEL